MAAEIINLRQRRKQARRAAERSAADASAARHGVPKAARDAAKAEAERAARALDGVRVAPGSPEASTGAPGAGPDDGSDAGP